ncbi:MAG: hypothetical protein J0H15_14510 [Xanthomonadales bacterium]|nr:hypothetical protein [Xanthomonadales bacterium]
MTTPAWPRPQWKDSGDEAFLLWFVFGDFGDGFTVDAEKYRTRGTPPGIDVVRFVNRELARWDGYPLAGMLGGLLYGENPLLVERAKRAGECAMLRGSIPDPADFDGLRDLVGTITALVDAGGVAVVDPQTLSMFDAATWRERFFAGDAFQPRDHVLVLCDEDEENPGRLRVHSRGLRKFARADIDIRNVPPELAEVAGGLASELVDFQGRGGLVPDGHVIELEGAGTSMTVRRAGGLQDPAFNNHFLALRWP